MRLTAEVIIDMLKESKNATIMICQDIDKEGNRRITVDELTNNEIVTLTYEDI